MKKGLFSIVSLVVFQTFVTQAMANPCRVAAERAASKETDKRRVGVTHVLKTKTLTQASEYLVTVGTDYGNDTYLVRTALSSRTSRCVARHQPLLVQVD